MTRKLVATGVLGLVCFAATLVNCASQAVAAPDTPDKETVVLLHGLGRSSSSMWIFAFRLKRAGFQVELVGYDSINQTPDEILEEISEQIRECCANVSGQIHFVAQYTVSAAHCTTVGTCAHLAPTNSNLYILDKVQFGWGLL